MDTMDTAAALWSDLVYKDGNSAAFCFSYTKRSLELFPDGARTKKKNKKSVPFRSLKQRLENTSFYRGMPCVCNAGLPPLRGSPLSQGLAAGSWQRGAVPSPAGGLMPSKWLISSCSSGELAV